MTHSPLIVVVVLLTAAGLCSLAGIAEPMGVGNDRTLQLAMIHAELACCTLLFLPLGARTRGAAFRNLLAVAACFTAASASVLLLDFVARGGLPWQSRGGALGAWLFAGGAISLGARLGGSWVMRARVALLCMFALPPLAHYLALEYASASLLHLRPVSPSWALAAGTLSWWPLLPMALLPWAAALALPAPKQAEVAL
ncbi:MAG: hypothetical protein IT464_11370 [Planctomycetes bacterium]|nr:hypothetical protein [Planctomycetota bacterium]